MSCDQRAFTTDQRAIIPDQGGLTTEQVEGIRSDEPFQDAARVSGGSDLGLRGVEVAILPHPSPLPLGEGATPAAVWLSHATGPRHRNRSSSQRRWPAIPSPSGRGQERGRVIRTAQTQPIPRARQAVLPHPSPLPLGEGATSAAVRRSHATRPWHRNRPSTHRRWAAIPSPSGRGQG